MGRKLSVREEFLFTIQRQPEGRWPNNEGWVSLAAMWIARGCLVGMGLLLGLLWLTR